MMAHPSASLVSALLPLAQSRGLSGAEVLLAYVAGFEINVALGRQLNPRLYEAGWHVTRTLGVLGVTAAYCRLLKLGPRPFKAALGIAASVASGLRQNFGTMTMALHAGLTARDKELVGTLQVLLQSRRLLIPRSLPYTPQLLRELKTFQARTPLVRPEAELDWRDRPEEDLVLAVGLAAWMAERTLPLLDDPFEDSSIDIVMVT